MSLRNSLPRVGRCARRSGPLPGAAATVHRARRPLPASAKAKVLSPSCRGLSSTALRQDAASESAFEQVQQAVPEVSSLPASTDLLELYRGMVTAGRLRWDDEQVRCIIKLKHLLETLEEYEPPLELLSQLNPSAPFRIREATGGWWKSNKARSDLESYGEQGRELIKVLSGEEELSQLSSPKGILITGPPGTGKSLLLSLFYHLLPTTKKRRVHYHAFTLGLYRQVFQEMQRRRDEIDEVDREGNRDTAAQKGWRAVFAGGRYDTETGGERKGWTKEDTIPFVIARDMILEYHILYFDELQLVDASSAALLRDVLSWYWRLGGVIVSCSNRVPDDLYHHGIQRDRMASFLDALKSRCEVVELDGGRDWRRGMNLDDAPRVDGWFELGDPAFDRSWEAEGDSSPRSILVYGRKLPVPRATETACRFTFAELCEEALGPADYISLASAYKRIYIDDVPVLLLKQKNEARRLINLLDALYESRCQLHVRAAAPPEALFFPDALALPSSEEGAHVDPADSAAQIQAEALSETLHAPVRPNVSVYNYSPAIQASSRSTSLGGAESDVTRKDASRGQVGAFSVLGIFTGEDERFAYKRAVSRLIEMTTSPSYIHEEWLPLDARGRTWETANKAASMLNTFQGHLRSVPASSTSSSSSSSTSSPFQFRAFQRPHGAQEDGEDFAVEAGYSRPSTLVPRPKDDRGIGLKLEDERASAPEGQDEAHAALSRSGPEGRNEAPGITHQNSGTGPRVNPPKIGEQHVWGTQEGWGPKAGKWGQGAGAFRGVGAEGEDVGGGGKGEGGDKK